MPHFRVPFFGSLLIETDIKELADSSTGMWCASMKQVTHSVEMQPIRPEVKGVEFCVERSKVEDVTESLKLSMARDAEPAAANPGGQVLAGMFGFQLSDLQTAWESHELEKMHPASERGPDFA
jgi:hypothetical protein